MFQSSQSHRLWEQEIQTSSDSEEKDLSGSSTVACTHSSLEQGQK